MGSEVAGGFACSICGERHVLPLSYSVKAPMAAAEVPPSRMVLSAEQCVIDDKDFYLRGRIPVPIHGFDEPFIWGVWVEISPKNFLRTVELWKTPGREAEPGFAGYLNSEILIYGNTINLEVEVRTQVVGRRPHFFVRDESHPLAVEQRDGISLRRVEEIAEMMLHPASIKS